jgi:hypothetical protein
MQSQSVPKPFPSESRLEFGILFFCGTGVGTQGLHIEPLHQPFLVMDFFEIGVQEIFAQTGFEL